MMKKQEKHSNQKYEMFCKKKISPRWAKCELSIKTVGKWTKEKKTYSNTLLKPVCYDCLKR